MAADSEPTPRSSSVRPVVPTILVADDDHDLLALMARRLENSGSFRVVTASDGQQAYELAAQVLPDLALLDVMMPKLTGIQVLARLRSDPSTCAMKIVLVSASFNGGGGEPMSGSGADGQLGKPFGRGEPVDTMLSVLANGRPHTGHGKHLGRASDTGGA